VTIIIVLLLSELRWPLPAKNTGNKRLCNCWQLAIYLLRRWVGREVKTQIPAGEVNRLENERLTPSASICWPFGR
jgi:hypothetical protein